MDVGNRIREFRKRSQLKIVNLADLIGVSRVYLSNVERGKEIPTLKTLEKICSVLGVTFTEFFAEEIPDLPPDLCQLLHEAESLSPEQRKSLIELIRSMKS